MPKLSLQVQAPAPNTVLHPGDLVHVAGIATGSAAPSRSASMR